MKVYLITGDTPEGRSAHIEEHKQEQDIVIDIALLRAAINSDIAYTVREWLYNMVEQRTVECNAVWVSVGAELDEHREQLAIRLDGEVVEISKNDLSDVEI